MKEVFGLNAVLHALLLCYRLHLGVKSFTECTRKFLEEPALRAAAAVAGCSCGCGLKLWRGALPSPLAPHLLGAWFRAPSCHDGDLIRLPRLIGSAVCLAEVRVLSKLWRFKFA